MKLGNGIIAMDETVKEQMKFCDYFKDWINVYKQGAVRDVTMRKYQTTLSSLRKIIPELKCCEMNRLNYFLSQGN